MNIYKKRKALTQGLFVMPTVRDGSGDLLRMQVTHSYTYY